MVPIEGKTTEEKVVPTNRKTVVPTNRKMVVPTKRKTVMPTAIKTVVPTNKNWKILNREVNNDLAHKTSMIREGFEPTAKSFDFC